MLGRATFLRVSAAAAGVAALGAPAFADATPLHAGSSLDDDATPFIYAIQSGLFQKVGIDASLQRAASGSAVASGVIGGAFDLGKSSITSLCAAFARGVPVTMIAPAGEFDVNVPLAIALIVRSDAPIASGADLNGKTVAVSAINDFFSLATRAWVDAHGGDSSTIKLVEVPMAQVGATIEAGRIDAGVIIQPFLAAALVDGKIRALGNPGAALGAHYMQSCWFTTAAFAAKNPDTIDHFMHAMRDAATYVNGHHAETSDLLAKFTGLDPSHLSPVRIHQGVRIDPAQVQPLVDLQAKYKMIPQGFDVHQLIYPAALR